MNGGDLVVIANVVGGKRVGHRVVDDGDVVLELSDGARLRVRPIVVQVTRAPDRDPSTGQRLYMITSTTYVFLDRPPTEDVE